MSTSKADKQTHWTVAEVADELEITTGRVRQILIANPGIGLASKLGNVWFFNSREKKKFGAFYRRQRQGSSE